MTDGPGATPSSGISGSIRWVVGEARRFGPAILDQGVWSLAGFISSALVGRFLGAEGLGVFAIGTAIIFGLGGVVNSLVLDPSGVIGPRDHEDELRIYGGMVVAAASALGLAVALVGSAFLIVSNSDWATVVGVALVVSLPIYLGWAARRLPYLSERPGMALTGSVVYVFVVTAAILAANALGNLTPALTIAILGLGALAQSVTVLSRWRPSFSALHNTITWRTVAGEHWAFGRWFIAAEASSWMLNYGLAAISAVLIDLSAAGAFRASQVLLRPYGIVFVGIVLAYLPRLTRVVRSRGTIGADPAVRRIGWGLSAVATTVFVVLLLAGGPIMELVFGPEFAPYGWLVATLAGGMVLHGWIAAYSMGLQANNHPRDVFYGQLASAVMSLLAALLLGALWGLAGFAFAFVLATITRLAVVRARYRRLTTPSS